MQDVILCQIMYLVSSILLVVILDRAKMMTCKSVKNNVDFSVHVYVFNLALLITYKSKSVM